MTATQFREVDFLIVTALKDETEAVTNLLEEKEASSHEIIGKLSRQGSAGSYLIAVTEIGAMGTNLAQAVAREALSRLNPRRVILTGIAAGFPEAGVNFGDILVPITIVPYELAKVTESVEKGTLNWLKRLLTSVLYLEKKVTYEHRSLPLPVSFQLWHAANTLARAEAAWKDLIRTPRPDVTTRSPAVHCSSRYVLGCGDKIVATEFAEARKWLLEKYPGQVLGLEMESFGVLTACRMTETPFLVVKASQDPATAKKDEAREKDQWRVYACQAAAAFTITLARRFEIDSSALVQDHMKEVTRIVQILERDAPQPGFKYTVSRAESYALLKEGIYDFPLCDLSVLIPNDHTSAIALHGGGGTGKSTIIKSLIGVLIDSGLCPALVDLRRYSAQKKKSESDGGNDATLEDMLAVASVPRRNAHELERLAVDTRLVLLIDGLNEVAREVRTALIDYSRRLHGAYLIVTDRFGAAESLDGFSHATVDRLDPISTQQVFDQAFGAGSYLQLDVRLQKIYQRPFFLSLAIKTKHKYTGQSVWSGIFEQFFLNQLPLKPAELDRLADATLKAFDKDGSLDLSQIKQGVDGSIYKSLVEAEVLLGDETDFEHHLWRDYLVSRRLGQTEENPTDTIFDAVTTFASSLESLTLTVEQLKDRKLKDNFLKLIFDWSYVAAADCIADFQESEPGPRQLSLSIRTAILAAIAEKRFDAVVRTRQRAEETLRNHHYEFARRFTEAPTREILTEHIGRIDETEDWFKQWKTLFTRPRGNQLSAEEIDLIGSGDCLIGWTAANLARRSRLEDSEQQRVREIYLRAADSEEGKSVRWRVVHVLGAFPDNSNFDFLLSAAKNDSYHWVQYGAVRSLIELASQSENNLRDLVLMSVLEFVRLFQSSNKWMKRQILQEIVETAFIENAKEGWKDAVLPTLNAVVESADQSFQQVLRRRVASL